MSEHSSVEPTTPVDVQSMILGGALDPQKDSKIEVSERDLENNQDSVHEDSEAGVPIDLSAYAMTPAFKRSFLFAVIGGAVIGFVALGFLNVIKKVPELWYVKDGYPKALSTVDWMTGKSWWIGITILTTSIVGICKFVFHLPLHPDGLLNEIRGEHVEWTTGFLTLILGMVSISGGASLGPEAPLAAFGGGLATLLSEKIFHLSEEELHTNVLTGFAASFGGLFPNPLTAPLLVAEIGKPTNHSMDKLVLQGCAALISFSIIFGFSDMTFLGPVGNVAPKALSYSFKTYHMGVAALIGIVASFVGLLALIIVTLFKKLGKRISSIPKFERISVLVLPIMAGIIYGLIGLICPLTFGDGSEQIGPVILFGGNRFDVGLLIGTLLLKMVSLGVCTGFGLYGGFVFPMMFMGSIVGSLAHHWISSIPLELAITTGMIAVPCSFSPLPLTLTIVIASIFENGLYASVPVFVAALTSHLTVVGLGILARLQKGKKSQ